MKHTDTNVYTPKQKSLNANVTKRMHSWFWDWSRAGAAPKPLLRGAEPTILSNHLSEATLHMSSLIVAAHIFLQQNWWILRSLVLLFYCVVQRHTPVSVFCVCNTASASVTILHCSAVSFSKMLLLFILHIHHPFFFHVVFHRFSHALPLLPICHWPITSTVS